MDGAASETIYRRCCGQRILASDAQKEHYCSIQYICGSKWECYQQAGHDGEHVYQRRSVVSGVVETMEAAAAADIGIAPTHVPTQTLGSPLEKTVVELRLDIERLFSDVKALEGMTKVQRSLLRLCEDDIIELKRKNTDLFHVGEQLICGLFGTVFFVVSYMILR